MTLQSNLRALAADATGRTREGIQALLASLRTITPENPDRVAFAGVGALSSVAKLGGRNAVNTTSTAVALPFLLGTVYRADLPEERRVALSVALCIGAAGHTSQARGAQSGVTLGALALAVHYGLLSWLLYEKGARFSRGRVLPRALGWGAGVAVAAFRAPCLVVPTIVAGAPLVAVSALANDRSVVRSVPSYGYGHAGNLLLLTQAWTLAREAFFPEVAAGRVGDMAARGVELGAYLLLIDALTA